MVPDKLNRMHDWHKRVSNVSQIFGAVREIKEEVLESRKILEVFIGFFLSDLNFCLQLAKRSRVSTLVLLKEFKNLLDAFRV